MEQYSLYPFPALSGLKMLQFFQRCRYFIRQASYTKVFIIIPAVSSHPPGVRSPALEKLSPNFFDKPAGMWDT